MAKHRFFVSPAQFADSRVYLTGQDARQIRVVLRLKPGDEIAVLDGTGVEYRCVLETVQGAEVVARVGERVPLSVEPRLHITVVQALAKGEKIEQVIQHGTEIGVSRFLLIATERSVLKLDERRGQSRLERWQRIAKEAAEQSHRARIPEVLGIVSLREAMRCCAEASVAVLHPDDGAVSLSHWLSGATRFDAGVCVVVGPEGGLTEQEVALCEQHGATRVSLMPRILRTETAALVAVSQLLIWQEVFADRRSGS